MFSSASRKECCQYSQFETSSQQHPWSPHTPTLKRAGFRLGTRKGLEEGAGSHQSFFQTLWTDAHTFQRPGSEVGVVAALLQAGKPVFHLASFFLLSEDSALSISVGEEKTHTHKVGSQPRKSSYLLLRHFSLFLTAETMFPDQSDLSYGKNTTVWPIILQKYV